MDKYQEQLLGKRFIAEDKDEWIKLQEALFELGYKWLLGKRDLQEEWFSKGIRVGANASCLALVNGCTHQNIQPTPTSLVFDLLKQKRKEENMFTKDDLKTGMILERRDGQFAMVLLNTPKGDIFSGDIWGGFEENYHQDLISKFTKDGDVMAVWCPNSKMSFLREGCPPNELTHKLLWKREEAPKTVTFGGKEYTKEELDKLRESLDTLAEELEQ